MLAERVIVTAGAHRIPVVPAFASELDPSIRQLHSLDYRGPEQLAEGPVLVVGAANSGTDVALEAARDGHAVTLAGRHPGHVPIDIDTPIGNLMGGIFIRRLRSITIDTAEGRAMKREGLEHGVMLVRNSLADLERAGVVQVGRIERVEAGRPVTADGTAIDAATVVWCTGSRPDLGWIDIDGRRGRRRTPDRAARSRERMPRPRVRGHAVPVLGGVLDAHGHGSRRRVRRGVARRGADRVDRRSPKIAA